MFKTGFEKIASTALKRYLAKSMPEFKSLQKATNKGSSYYGLKGYKAAVEKFLPKSRAEIQAGKATVVPQSYKPTLDEMISGRKRYKTKQGTYSIVDLHRNKPTGNLVGAYDSKREVIGKTRFGPNEGNKPGWASEGTESHVPRQGIATEMYKHINKTGPKLRAAVTLSADGKKLSEAIYKKNP